MHLCAILKVFAEGRGEPGTGKNSIENIFDSFSVLGWSLAQVCCNSCNVVIAVGAWKI